jgi:RNA polymerase sigma-70 factor (ECF subfamily)
VLSKQVPDKAYFVEMIYTHMGIIYKICKLYAAEEDRDDLKQEIIYQLWRSYPTFRGDSKFQSWMYRVALNTAMLGLRAIKVKYTRLNEHVLEISDDSVEQQDEEIRIKFLYKQISNLKDLDKTIIFLYLEQCSYEEIAEITGISTKNVSVRLVRIKEKLRAKLHMQTTEV